MNADDASASSASVSTKRGNQKTLVKRAEVAASIRDVTRQVRLALFQVAFFSFFINLLVLTLPLYMMQVFDRVVPTRHLETLFFLTVITAVAIAVYAVLEAVRSRCLIRMGAWAANRLKPDIRAACMRSH